MYGEHGEVSPWKRERSFYDRYIGKFNLFILQKCKNRSKKSRLSIFPFFLTFMKVQVKKSLSLEGKKIKSFILNFPMYKGSKTPKINFFHL